MTTEAWNLETWWKDWKDFGMLPYPGSMADQPYYVAEVIRRCEHAFVKAQEAEIRRLRKEVEHKGG